MSFEELIDLSIKYDAEKEDYSGRDYRFRFGPDMALQAGKIGSLEVIPGLKLNDWALDQVCTKLGPIAYQTGTNRKLPKELITVWSQQFPEETAALLNAHIVKQKNPWYVRTYQDTVRAVLSTHYAPVDNTEVLKTVEQALVALNRNTNDLRMVRPELTQDRLGLKVLLSDVDTHTEGEQPFGIGFFLGNDEVGNGMLRVNSLIQRHSCLNSVIFAEDEGNFAAFHRGLSDFLKDRLAQGIAHILKITGEKLRIFLNSRQIIIPDLEKVVLDWAKDEGWDTTFTAGVLQGTEGQSSLFGLVNGITYAAHTTVRDSSKQHDLEVMAGQMLMEPDKFLRTHHAA